MCDEVVSSLSLFLPPYHKLCLIALKYADNSLHRTIHPPSPRKEGLVSALTSDEQSELTVTAVASAPQGLLVIH